MIKLLLVIFKTFLARINVFDVPNVFGNESDVKPSHSKLRQIRSHAAVARLGVSGFVPGV